MPDATINNALQVMASAVIFGVLLLLFVGLLFDVMRTVRRGIFG